MFDVVIVGGGAAGACTGALLATQGTQPPSVAILEPRAPEAPLRGSPLDARVVALSRASERLLLSAGAWERLDGARLAPYERMHVWHESVASRSAGVLTFDAAEAGEPNLGYIAEARALQAALLAAFTAGGGHLETAAFTSLAIAENEVQVVTSNGTLRTRLVIGADGAQSAVRASAGLTVRSASYAQTALVATVATERAHEASAWQRFLHDGTLAFLPLPDGSSSIVWSADEARAAELLVMTDAAFARALDAASDRVLGGTRLLGERRSFPLQRLSATRYVAPRVALIGDAAHVVHPLAGQGVNLGLLDAAALAQEIGVGRARREDPGALAVLRAYERWRKSEVAAMAAAIDGFDRLLAHGGGPLAQLARRGLSFVNRAPEVKRFFIRRALGLSGELPRAARRAHP